MPWRLPSRDASFFSRYGTVLFALGLLGVLLLGLALAGVLTLWKDWLEQNWSLTFPSPLSFAAWMVLLGVLGAVVLLYFLKLRRQPVKVPSTFLWRKSVEDLHVNSLFQWLRKNILLILQLLFLILLGYGLANPTYNSTAQGRHFIFLVDNSASMSATDETPTRLDKAKAEVRRRIEAMDTSDQAMLITFNQEAYIMQAYTNRKEALLRALDRITPSQQGTRLLPALQLAEGQANPRRSAIEGSMEDPLAAGQMPRATDKPEGIPAQVVIFSDGQFPDVPDFSPGNLKMRLVPVGKSGDNVGITRVQLRKSGTTPTLESTLGFWSRMVTLLQARGTTSNPEEHEVDVRVHNFMATELKNRVAVQLELFVGGERVDRQSKPLRLSPRTVEEIDDPVQGKKRIAHPGISEPTGITTFSFRAVTHGYVRLTLVDQDSGQPWQDAFPLDNTAWLALTPVRRPRVLHIGPSNEWLRDRFLEKLVRRQRVAVTSLPTKDFANTPEYRAAVAGEAYDLVIFDRTTPPSLKEMPKANTFFIGQCPPWPGASWTELPILENLYIKDFRVAHPLLQGIDTLQGMTIKQARALKRDQLPQRASALMESQKEPVLWALGRDRFTDLVLTFPLVTQEGNNEVANTNWPKQPVGTLPLFLDNVVSLMGGYRDFEEPHKPGLPKSFLPTIAAQSAQVRRVDPPGGETVRLLPTRQGEWLYNAPASAGLYEVNWGEPEPFRFAVNLCDTTESDVQPRYQVEIGPQTVEAAPEQMRERQPLWPWFALGALLLLLVEWWVYQRRVAI
jgi:hypothetical protein